MASRTRQVILQAGHKSEDHRPAAAEVGYTSIGRPRREWDSNPRDPLPGPPVFKTDAFDRSAIPPTESIAGPFTTT